MVAAGSYFFPVSLSLLSTVTRGLLSLFLYRMVMAMITQIHAAHKKRKGQGGMQGGKDAPFIFLPLGPPL
jgi:hypothetical protein